MPVAESECTAEPTLLCIVKMIFRECRLLNKSSAKVLSLSEKDCILRTVCLFKYVKRIANCTNDESLFA